MGRLEKIVVSVVLFLVAIILGISLGTDPEPESQVNASNARNAPLTPAERQARAEALRNQRAGAAEQPSPQSGAPGGLMSTSLAPRESGAGGAQPAAAQTAGAAQTNTPPNPLPAGPAIANGVEPGSTSNGGQANPVAPGVSGVSGVSGAPTAPLQQAPTEFLVSRAGLVPTASDEFMSYTWQTGDSYRALAQRFYGSPLHVKRLRDANEGRDEAKFAVGDSILVASKPTAEGDRIARPSARDAKDKSASTVVGGTYTVGSGDVLGTISQKVYGTATKWRKIYDANRDVIGGDPNQLKPGMVLRIPQ